MSLTAEERSSKLQALLENGWKMTDGRDAIEKTFMFKVRPINIDDIFDTRSKLF